MKETLYNLLRITVIVSSKESAWRVGRIMDVGCTE